jgi:hypothetical protein
MIHVISTYNTFIKRMGDRNYYNGYGSYNNSSNYPPNNNDYQLTSSKSKQHSNNKQKVVLDQNFSNQTYYTMMSTLESIAIYYQNQENKNQNYQNKMFKNYDRVNYS